MMERFTIDRFACVLHTRQRKHCCSKFWKCITDKWEEASHFHLRIKTETQKEQIVTVLGSEVKVHAVPVTELQAYVDNISNKLTLNKQNIQNEVRVRIESQFACVFAI
jgi:hypothetical protein